MVNANQQMQRRPNIKLKMTYKEKMSELFGALFLIAYWVFVLYFKAKITGNVPTHFDAAGHPDYFGEKGTLTTLPIYATILYFFLTLLSRVPQYFNYLEEITAENAAFQYRRGVNMIRILKILVVAVFLLISALSIMNSENYTNQIANRTLILIPYVFMIPIFYYLFAGESKK